jgi:hypothetical protein
MRLDEFQQIIARHKGLRDDPAVLDAQIEGTDKFNRPGKVPNPTPTYRYIFNDGTTLEARSQAGGDIQITNPGTAENKAGVQDPTDPNKAPETKTFPDGTERQWDPAKRDWVIIATKPQGPAEATPPDIHTNPDGSQSVFNPATGKYEPYANAKPAAAGPAPGTEAIPSADRPGQTTDLAAVKSQAQMTWDSLTADVQAGRITPEQRTQKWSSYYTATVAPALEAANREAVAEAERQRRRQTQADTIAQQAAARAGRTEERQSTTAERTAKTAEDRLALDTQKASYDRGQDAVSNALKLLQYQVDPSFSPALAGIYNRIMPGAFQPNAFQTALPDLDAIAQAHIGPLLDMHASPVTGPTAQGAAALTAAQPPGQAPPDPLANVPITPRAPYPQPGGTGVVGRFGQ